jgi:hypothetical protein
MPKLARNWPPTLAAVLTLAFVAGSAVAQTSGARGSSAPTRPAQTAPATTSSGSLGSNTTTRPPVTTVTPSTGASSSLPPTQQLPAIAPLSPQLPTQFATGSGTTSSNLALSPGSSGASSSAAPSAPGGGGKTLKDCMGFWEAATHMTKAEWKAACLRTMNRIANP